MLLCKKHTQFWMIFRNGPFSRSSQNDLLQVFYNIPTQFCVKIDTKNTQKVTTHVQKQNWYKFGTKLHNHYICNKNDDVIQLTYKLFFFFCYGEWDSFQNDIAENSANHRIISDDKRTRRMDSLAIPYTCPYCGLLTAHVPSRIALRHTASLASWPRWFMK